MENRRKADTYMWLANMQTGPTLKFLVQNIHTMEELKFSGNCLRGSRPFLSFDPAFETNPWSRLTKEILAQTFGTPAYHPRSQPFFDHVFVFRLLDKRIWFRNYQVIINQATYWLYTGLVEMADVINGHLGNVKKILLLQYFRDLTT